MKASLLGAMVIVAALASPALAVAPGPAAIPPGCVAGRAVAHYPGGATGSAPPTLACGVTTGFAGAESHIVATADAVIFMPAVKPSGTLGTGSAPVPVDSSTQSNADPAGLAVTSNGGATWSLVKPADATWNPTDHGDYVDPATNRLFFEDYGPIPLAPAFGAAQEGPAHVMWTDTPTSSSSWHHTVLASMFLPENPRFTSAPPPIGAARPAGYPDVVYFCANTNVGFVSPVIAGRMCFKSLDGGTTFAQTGVLFTGTAPRHPECGANGEIYSAIDGYYPQPAPDGSLYVMVACGGATFLARSTDEAATFPVIHDARGKPVTVPAPPPAVGQVGSPDLRIGPNGAMYVMWMAASRLVVIASVDAGRAWTAPVDVSAPGVVVSQWAMAQRGAALGVAYLGHRPGQVTQDAYITELQDVTALQAGGRPLFVTAQVNNAPIYYGTSIQGSGYVTLPLGQRVPFPPPFGNQTFGNDFIGATIAPDGSVWGSFDQDCGGAATSPGCQAQNDQTRGFAGRLIVSAAGGVVPQPAALPATGGSPGVAIGGLLAAFGGLVLARFRRARGVSRLAR